MKKLIRLIVIVALCAGFYTLGQRPGSPRIAEWFDRPAETSRADRDSGRPEWLDTTVEKARRGIHSALMFVGGEDRPDPCDQAAREAPPMTARYEREPIPQCW
ncbi:MAG: hypothetical protein GX591_14670 [Planctomycetes bacterium]|nr:hypothetical protein [Planctomycetota bacterium]